MKRDSFRGQMQKDRNVKEKRGLAQQIPMATVGLAAAAPLVVTVPGFQMAQISNADVGLSGNDNSGSRTRKIGNIEEEEKEEAVDEEQQQHLWGKSCGRKKGDICLV